MDSGEGTEKELTRVRAVASEALIRLELIAYLVVGLLLALAALVGIVGATASLWHSVQDRGAADSIVMTIDRLLFVLMVVEILHTVRDSFRSGTIVCEPFLIVGLIASIRRVLVITLESSRVNAPGAWSTESRAMIESTMLELTVLGGLILVMVISIYVLRRSEPRRSPR